jgi:hypothetical protein
LVTPCTFGPLGVKTFLGILTKISHHSSKSSNLLEAHKIRGLK